MCSNLNPSSIRSIKEKIMVLVIVMLYTANVSVSAEQNHNDKEPSVAHWGYKGSEGPASWGDLDSSYYLCRTGRKQSPVDLQNPVSSNLDEIEFHYKTGPSSFVNNSHTLQYNYSPEYRVNISGKSHQIETEKKATSYIDIAGKDYQLLQFHFHAPSEHTYNGKQYPMEVHLVHADKQGQLVVIGIFIEEGNSNQTMKEILANMPEEINKEETVTNATLSAQDLLPHNKDYFYYNGSLTTPPCSEDVKWFVMKEPIQASPDFIRQFKSQIITYNARPVQPLNGRKILIKKD